MMEYYEFFSDPARGKRCWCTSREQKRIFTWNTKDGLEELDWELLLRHAIEDVPWVRVSGEVILT